MPYRTTPSRSELDRLRDLPTWTNVLLTDEVPIRWTTEPGAPAPGDELVGRLVIGEEDQLVIDFCGTAVTNLLTVLARAHHEANIPLPPAVHPVSQTGAPRLHDGPVTPPHA